MRASFAGVLAAVTCLACNDPAPVGARIGTSAAGSGTRQATLPEAEAPQPATSHDGAPPNAADRISGIVLESMDAGGYTYLRLKGGAGDAWAAVRQTTVEKGKLATVVGSVWMERFESKTLNRTFERILFGSLEADATKQLAAAHRIPPPAADVGEIKVARADGPRGKLVAEVHAQKAALNDQPVEVRGKVVKFLPGIMGRNWLHLRDGSGSRERADDDLTVTTQQTAAVGHVILVKGSLGVDRDFGSGYKYSVIVEDATLAK
jgi:hypothetical protein